ncbi:hypothetical protein [Rivularia sp. UHCC 0363]|uniref:hypothetical protein n=1 Tax=Rivularia sp. UHCC 0363 TaxID=3110244 RepID=UPI002B220C43|nr:hypothetical protein [Rivularia sp. UHCC 0363]MEA5594139.1 hypothetical protein [Rivularia sp. UHCC 0363]
MTNNLAVSLLTHYSFDLGGYGASELVKRWENQYPSNWVHLGIIEALYQGRYKAVSVQQILTLWLRRNYPSYHFNLEFESLICNKLPEDLKWNRLPPALPSVASNSTIKELIKNYQSSQIVNSSYQKSIARNNDKTESTSAEVENKSSDQNVPKALPVSSKIVVSASKSPTATTYSTYSSAPQTLTETRHIVTDSKITLEEQLEDQLEAPFISKTIAKLLPPARNHPPIEQFTPEKSDSSDIFTSKLKAIVED